MTDSQEKTSEQLIAELQEMRLKLAVSERAEAKHAQVAKLYETLANSSPVGVYIYQDGNFVFVNPQFRRHTGYSEAELLAMPPRLIIYPEDRAAARQNAINMLKGIIQDPYEFRYNNKNGETLWAMEKVTSITYNGKRATLGNFMDITALKQAEAKLLDYQHELRSMAAQLSLAEERERRIIATDLHDHVSQSLAICNMKLGAMLELSSADRYFTKNIKELRTLISQMIKETRTLSFSISSPLLYLFGLDAAIEQLSEDMTEQYGIDFKFEASKRLRPMEDDVRILLYRTVYEIFTNIIKHARARHVQITMKQLSGALRITIEDDGIGFDTSRVTDNMRKTKGFGLFSVRERISYIGGRVDVQSQPGAGTKVTITAPVKVESKGDVIREKRKIGVKV